MTINEMHGLLIGYVDTAKTELQLTDLHALLESVKVALDAKLSGLSATAAVAPVDHAATTTTDGRPSQEVRVEQRGESGMHKSYIVLTEAERAKGFVRPVRRAYKHEKCGTTTTMGQAIAETYARSPDFYGSTFCVSCGGHYPVGETGEFVWTDGGSKVGS